jgi:hypothetical protein
MSRWGCWCALGLVAAWVLWARIASLNPPLLTWRIEDAYPSKPACEADLDAALNLRRRNPDLWVEGNTVRLSRSPGWQMAYFCLPDTLDPREPKR